MAILSVHLPETLQVAAQARAEKCGFDSVDAYIASLVADDVSSAESLEVDLQKLTPAAKEELRQQIHAGIAQVERGECEPWEIESIKARIAGMAKKGS